MQVAESAAGCDRRKRFIERDAQSVLAHDERELLRGGRRLMQEARGYKYTLCAGQVIVEGDRFTGLTPGKLVRGSQTA